MKLIKITSHCTAFGRHFAEHDVLPVETSDADALTYEQARELILAGRAFAHDAEPAPARPLSIETAELAQTNEAAAARPSKGRKAKA